MGIYIQSFANLSAKLSVDPQATLIASARRWAQHKGLDAVFFASAPEELVADICICPSADSITFNIGAQRVDFGTKTSSAGPGYHAAVVDLCDHFGRDLGLQWRWDAGGDETGYAASKDRAALNEAFLEQLRGFGEFWSQSDPSLAYVMNLVVDLGGDTPGMISTPLGLRDVATLAAMADAQEDELRALAPTLYPWWFDADEGRFWTQTLRAMLWTEAVWRKPASDWEAHVHTAAAALILKIASLHEACPEDLQQALRELHQSIAADRPAAGHIGYRRRPMRIGLTGYWSIKVPGHYRESLENEGETVCLSTVGEEIRSSSWTRKGAPSGEWPGRLKDQPETTTSTHVFRVPISAQPTREGWGRVAFGECVSRSIEGEVHYLLVSIASELQEAELLGRIEAVLRDVVFQLPEPLPQTDSDA